MLCALLAALVVTTPNGRCACCSLVHCLLKCHVSLRSTCQPSLSLCQHQGGVLRAVPAPNLEMLTVNFVTSNHVPNSARQLWAPRPSKPCTPYQAPPKCVPHPLPRVWVHTTNMEYSPDTAGFQWLWCTRLVTGCFPATWGGTMWCGECSDAWL